MGDDEHGRVAPVQGREGLVQVGGVADVLADVHPRLQGWHRRHGRVQGDAHVVNQERVHHEHRGKSHRNVSLKQDKVF